MFGVSIPFPNYLIIAFIFLVLVDLPFLENEENDIVREKVIELCKTKHEHIFPISAINGTGLEMLTDKMHDIVENLRANSELLGKEVE